MTRYSAVSFGKHSFFWLGLLVVCFSIQSQTAAADQPASVTCSSLHTSLSDDKNYYIFTASSSGNNNAIAGYTFSFGDRQTYTVRSDTSGNQDHHTVTVRHTY